MSSYVQTILTAVIAFPFIAFLFTFPYIIYNYRPAASPDSLPTRCSAENICLSFGFSILPVALRGTSMKMTFRGRL